MRNVCVCEGNVGGSLEIKGHTPQTDVRLLDCAEIFHEYRYNPDEQEQFIINDYGTNMTGHQTGRTLSLSRHNLQNLSFSNSLQNQTYRNQPQNVIEDIEY